MSTTFAKHYASMIDSVKNLHDAEQDATCLYRTTALAAHAEVGKIITTADAVAAAKHVNAGTKIDGDDVPQIVKDVRVASTGGINFLTVVGAFYASGAADDAERFADYRDVRRFVRSVVDSKDATGKAAGAAMVRTMIEKAEDGKAAVKGLTALRTNRKAAAQKAADEKREQEMADALAAGADADEVANVTPDDMAAHAAHAATKGEPDSADALALALAAALAAGATLSQDAADALAAALGMIPAK